MDKFDLVSKILSAKPNSKKGLRTFKKLLYGDFLKFANDESSLAEEANAILMMQAIEKELQLIIGFPTVYSKNIIAIGGGFSSGKSAFVNSFFKQKNIKLPIGIEPVTAIPTYVVSSNKNFVKGFSNSGGSIDIDVEFYGKLSHDFVKSFNFNLKKIMPFMTIGTPLDQKYFKDICLIDTPGYNPSISDGFTERDKKTAFEFLERANALIWMIGLDSNGTIPASDLKFLSKLDLTNKKLFIVANKSDLKPKSELNDILEEIEDILNDSDIDFDGISAFSANFQKEDLYKKMSLFDFLQKENNPTQIQEKIISKIDTVFNMYKNAIEKDKKKMEKMKSNINSLELDLVELGLDIESSDSSQQEMVKNFMQIFNS